MKGMGKYLFVRAKCEIGATELGLSLDFGGKSATVLRN